MVTVTLKLASVFEGVLFSRVGGFSLTGPSRKLKKNNARVNCITAENVRTANSLSDYSDLQWLL